MLFKIHREKTIPYKYSDITAEDFLKNLDTLDDKCTKILKLQILFFTAILIDYFPLPIILSTIPYSIDS